MLLAYIDPGSGALVWQMVVAGLMGLLFYFSKVRNRIARGLRSLFKGGSRTGSDPARAPQKD